MNTIKLAVEHERNRDLLTEWLDEICDVRAGDGATGKRRESEGLASA